MPAKLAKIKSTAGANFIFRHQQEDEEGNITTTPIVFIFKNGIVEERDGEGVTRLPDKVWQQIKSDPRISRRLDSGEFREL